MLLQLCLLFFFTIAIILPMSGAITEISLITTMGKMLNKYHWLFFQHNMEITKQLAKSKVMTNEIDSVESSMEKLVLVFSNLNEAIRMKKKINPSQSIWIVQHEYKRRLIDDLRLQLTDIFIFLHIKESCAILTSVYRVSKSNPVKEEILEVYDLTNTNTVNKLRQLFDYDGRNLNGSTIKVGINSYTSCCSKCGSPFEMIECEQRGIVSDIAESMGFKMELKDLSSDVTKTTVFSNPNGSYSGLFLDLAEEKVELSVGSFVVTSERLREFNFIWPTFEAKAVIFMKMEVGNNVWTSFVAPFNFSVWYAFALSFFLAGCALMITINSSKRKTNFKLYSYQMPHEIIFNELHTLFSQSISTMPSNPAYRIIYITLFLTMIILMQAYSGSIISNLTVQKSILPFQSLDELLQDGKYKITSTIGGFIKYYLEFLSPPKISSIVALKKVDDETAGFNEICYEFLVFAALQQSYQPDEEVYKCAVLELPITLLRNYFAIASPKNISITNEIRKKLLLLREGGMLYHMNQRLHPKKNSNTEPNKTTAITEKEIVPLLTLLSIGIFAALVILVIENFMYKDKGKKNDSEGL